MSTFPPVSPQDGGGNDDTMFSLKTSKKSEAPQNSRAFSPSNKFQPLPLFVSSNIKAGRSSVSSVSGILDSNGIASSSRPVTNQSNVLKPSKPASLFQQQNPDVFRPTTDASFRNSTPQSPLLLRIPVSYQSSPYLPMSPIASLVQASSPTIGSSIAPSLGMPSPTLPNRHGGMSPKFFDTAHNHYGRRSAKREKNVFQDLLEATRKSMSAGMGEWDLQSVEWSHDEFREHLLKGPLGPETLKNVYRMSEGDIFKLYRALYTYSVGFCSTVTETTKKAQHQEQLLDSIIEVYAQLWDEVMGISFKSDLVDDLNGVKGATAALQQATARLAKYQEENSQLQARLNDFVKGSVDRSVQYKQLDDKARELEGEAVTLSLANEKMSIRVAGAEIQVQALSSQLELKEQNIKELRACFEIQDAANQRLKAALREQQSTATRQYFQIVELEKALAEARRATQDVEVEAQKAAERYAAGPKVDEATWERRMADKTLAYNLLHSDYVVKMHDLNELRIIDAKLNQQVALMEDTYNTAKRQIEQSKAQTEKYRRRWENGRMFTADVESANRRQASRIRELVKSYWPLTSRLKEAEAGMKRLRCESDAVEARSREVEAQMMVLRSEVADHDRLVEEMKRLKAEMSLDHVKLSEGCMAVLHPDAESARAYVRTTQRRIQDLTKQLVRLVDVHAGAEDRIHKHQAAEEGLKLQLQQLENVLKVRAICHNVLCVIGYHDHVGSNMFH
ncbi:hypothetical protein CEUSTIGMA_g11158.t1 [Chlamydomonas eustigma]|uniref:Uncharacterized protein n=1 Tax=Chlamydomonas eustigma TaxID=1157962 RepID=A0A250XL30_9CHLO|nr:hypothetical protein CEUSTIGMA_g11158.t1 [Chlamydomonas eustigma]|eukprot:GAX83733.1 hypothetical protein CEUSTIGMA_g11158.t1 [Chlamydomonas eustigma]